MSRQRIEYLDAMRGLAMLFVVMGHIVFFCFRQKPFPGLIGLTNLTMVPLFYLVSGFFAYRLSGNLTMNGIFGTVCRKFTQLVVPAVVFMTVYVFYDGGITVRDAFLQSFKYGYWFTFALFLFFLLYLPFARLAASGSRLFDMVLVFEAVVAFLASIYCHKLENESMSVRLFGLIHIGQYMFFVAGILWHRHKEWVNGILANNTVISTVCISLFLGGLYAYSYRPLNPSEGLSDTLCLMALTFIGLAFIVILFRKYKTLSGDNLFGRFLKLCGTYSLEIYFIHYFILPKALSPVGEMFEAYPNEILEFTLVALLGIFISCVSVLIGRTLSVTPFLSGLLFGKNFK